MNMNGKVTSNDKSYTLKFDGKLNEVNGKFDPIGLQVKIVLPSKSNKDDTGAFSTAIENGPKEKLSVTEKFIKKSQCESKDGLEKSVNGDRFLTTYQADFSHKGTDLSFKGNHESCATTSKESELCSRKNCNEFVREGMEDYIRLKRLQKSAKQTCKFKVRKKKKEETSDNSSNIFSPWKTEYQDVIGKTGKTIMKDHLHVPKLRKKINLAVCAELEGSSSDNMEK